jgi:PLD-like domain
VSRSEGFPSTGRLVPTATVLPVEVLPIGCCRASLARPSTTIAQGLYETDDLEFRRALSSLLWPPIVEGNKVDTLLNGDQIFPAMLAAIRSAKTTITFETYIYRSGSIGEEFVDALVERAAAGVRVHVLLDWAGSVMMEDSLLHAMERGGVQMRRFHEPHWSNWDRLNNRTHRKLLVVAGRVGFTGGVGMPISGEVRRATRMNGAIPTFALKAPWSHRCRRSSSTTGCVPQAKSSMARRISPPSNQWEGWQRRCSAVRPAAEARACSC